MGHRRELRRDGGWRCQWWWGGSISQGGGKRSEWGQRGCQWPVVQGGILGVVMLVYVLYVVQDGSLYSYLLGCWHCHVALIAFLHHLWLKLMGHPCCWVAYFQSIYQMGWGCLSGPCVARTLTVLEQSSVQLWGKVSTPGPNKWYGLNGKGNDFYPSSLIWPRGCWWDGGRWYAGRVKISVSQFHTWTLHLDLILLEQDNGARKV